MIRSLEIRNWKAFEEKVITFDDGITFFVGPNGTGKTTVLEAICLAITGESVTADFQELVINRNLPAEVVLNLEVDGIQVSIGRKFKRDTKMSSEIVLDGQTQTMKWDDVSSMALRLLSVGAPLFQRLTYMSEGEVFRYLEDPPGEALNSRIQEIFGIASLQILGKYTRTIIRTQSSSIREMSSELRTITDVGPIDESRLQETQRLRTGLEQREENLLKEKEKLSKLIQETQQEKKQFEDLKNLGNEIAQTFDDIIHETSEPFDMVLEKIIREFAAKMESEDEKLGNIQALRGSVQGRIAHLEEIRKLLQAVIDNTARIGEVPCPVCKRPIDDSLANRLISDIAKEVKEAQKELVEAQKALKEKQVEINEMRDRMRKARDCETRLNTFPGAIIDKARPLTLDKVDEMLSLLGEFLRIKNQEADQKTSELDSVKQELHSKTEELANIKAAMKQKDRVTLLRDRLRSAYERQMLAEILHEALEDARQQQQDIKLGDVYRSLSGLWEKFKPESAWKVLIDEKGIINVASRDRQYDFSHLSGGEKTVLLVLTRVILSRLLAKRIDFLMIDEPLEHLDVRNRRSLLNFLVEACRKNTMPQMLVTTFEETLIRKYYEGEKTRAILLSKPLVD